MNRSNPFNWMLLIIVVWSLLGLLSACQQQTTPPLPPTPIRSTPTSTLREASVTPIVSTPKLLASATSTLTRTTTPIRATLQPTQTSIPPTQPVSESTDNSNQDKLLFLTKDDSNIQLYQINSDGSNKGPLAVLNYVNVFSIDISPDGTKIVFDAICTTPLSIIRAIYVMNVDSSGATTLTDCAGFEEESPIWSPDGTKIAYSVRLEGGNNEIFVMNADGSDKTQLTNNDRQDIEPAWSPDGSQIALQSVSGQNWEIYVMNADGSQLTQLTDNDNWDISPAWSPDGQQIAFVSDRDGNFEIYVMNANGSKPTRLTENSVREFSPIWSSDGKQIAFISERDGNSNIYIMNADGSHQVNLTFNPAKDFSSSPVWVPKVEQSGESASPSATPSIAATLACAENWSQLSVNTLAVVSGGPDDPPNRVRSEPSTSAEIIAQIDPGQVVLVVEGPVCADGLVFWKVESDVIPGGEGWTAEGDGTTYWLEPVQP